MSSVHDLTPVGVCTPESVSAWFTDQGPGAWAMLRNRAETQADHIHDDLIEGMCTRIADDPSACFAILLLIAARDARRRATLQDRCFALLERFPGEGLVMASHHLPQAPVLLESRWIAAARCWLDRRPLGAWGVLACAALHRPDLMDAARPPELVRPRSHDQRAWAIIVLARAASLPSERCALIGTIASTLESAPCASAASSANSTGKISAIDEGEVLGGVKAVVRDRSELRSARLLRAIVGALDAHEPAGWGLLTAWALDDAAEFTPEVIDRILDQAAGQVRRELDILSALLSSAGSGLSQLIIERYRDAIRRDPAPALDVAQYHFQLGTLARVDGTLVDAVASNLRANPCPGITLLRRITEHDPRLITADAVSAVISVATEASNVAFGFCLSAIQRRQDLSRLLTYGLFECLHREPINRAHVRGTEIRAITTMFNSGERREFLRRLLTDPPTLGNRRSRMLMQLMFGHPVLERRRLLRAALIVAATASIDIKDEHSGRYRRATPAWDALLLGFDCSSAGSVNAEPHMLLLEAIHHLRLEQPSPAAIGWLRDLDLGGIGPRPFGGDIAFLDHDQELTLLHGRVRAWAARFGCDVHLPRLKDLRDGCADARREADEIIRRLPDAKGEHRERLASRLELVRKRLGPLADIDPGTDAPIDAAAWEHQEMRLRIVGALRRETVRIPLDAANKVVRAQRA